MKTVKIKKLKENAQILKPAHEGDAGYDVVATTDVLLEQNDRYKMPLGIAMEMEPGFVCIVEGKSGLAAKKGLTTIGNVIDQSYRGEIHAILVNTSNQDIVIKEGDKVAQLVFRRYYSPSIEFVDDLSDSSRKDGAFGSTGK